GAAVTRWYDIDATASKDEKDDLSRLIALADKLIKELETLLKRFKAPIMRYPLLRPYIIITFCLMGCAMGCRQSQEPNAVF
ncbi:hypothetical protein BC938DRAFT_476301, partial [Jimgerdemannia flammicorona]